MLSSCQLSDALNALPVSVSSGGEKEVSRPGLTGESGLVNIWCLFPKVKASHTAVWLTLEQSLHAAIVGTTGFTQWNPPVAPEAKRHQLGPLCSAHFSPALLTAPSHRALEEERLGR